MQIKWSLNGFVDGLSITKSGEGSLLHTLHLQEHFDDEVTLGTVEGVISVESKRSERLFFNGYQSSTYSPEYRRYARQYGLKRMQEAVVRYFEFDRAGDYHIVGYPESRGIFHGFSWCYFREKDHYRLFASLDETPGYTIFFYDTAKKEMCIRRDCDGLRVKGDYHLFDLFYAEGSEAEVFDAWFKAMGIKPACDRMLAGYTTAHTHGFMVSEALIVRDLEAAEGILEAGDLIRIDHGWQSAEGDFIPDVERFPNGLKHVTDLIHKAGYIAGIRLSPFAVSKDSSVYQTHPEWLLQVNGKEWEIANRMVALDIDQLEVRTYLEERFRVIREEWGFDVIDCDLLFAAAPFGTVTESRAARMRRALTLLRSWCPNQILMVGDTPLMPAFGVADYARVANDLSLNYKDPFYMRKMHRERASTGFAMETMWNRRMLHERAFMNDTDVFFLNNAGCKMTPEEIEKVALYEALLGGTFLVSDDMSSYTPETIGHYDRLRQFTTRHLKHYHNSRRRGRVVMIDQGDVRL